MYITNKSEEENVYHAELKKKLPHQGSNFKYLQRNNNNSTNN